MLVPREHLPNAISLNTVMMQAASVAGPAIGGLIIAIGNVGWAYAVNSAVLPLRRRVADHDARRAGDDRRRRTRATRSRSRRSRTACASSSASPIIRSTMLLDFFATFFSSATALLPIFAQDMLHVGPRGYGWLYAAPAIGA